MSLCFRRLYATVPKPDVTTKFAARVASAPHKVNFRRIRRQQLARTPKVDTSAPLPALSLHSSPLSVGEKDRYDRLKRLGLLIREDKGFTEPTEEEWLAALDERRSRIRGTRKRTIQSPAIKDKIEVDDVVGVRVYLPNFEFMLVRNHTLPGQPYNPWEATFRVPLSITKLDIRSYLWAAYGVKCTYVRTQIILKRMRSRKRGRQAGKKSHKRAVVGLVEPFYYPEAPEDMKRDERQIRQDWLDSMLQHNRVELLQRQRVFAAINLPYKSRFKAENTRRDILKKVLARRQARESAVNAGAHVFLPNPSSNLAEL
ncbi:mitochondrial ribosomal protein L23 [Hysterangium stoloniferum]|nr:mitochondrial ribosomal protein L23 [Hysterangium stoloniferum]